MKASHPDAALFLATIVAAVHHFLLNIPPNHLLSGL
jgi:hypothetical protein